MDFYSVFIAISGVLCPFKLIILCFSFEVVLNYG